MFLIKSKILKQSKIEKKENVKEEKQDLFLNASSSRIKKIKDKNDSFYDDSYKEENMRLFVKRYHQY